MSNTETNLTIDSRVAQATDVISADVDEEVVMLRLNSNSYFNTDDIGAEIWRRMATPVYIRELCADLLTIFDVDPDRCSADVLAFLGAAHKEGIIRIVDTDAD